ncbi:MAG: prepilin-type N-terminal cleavage/methylation domain-containing protein [Planctomycetota bacterium]|nr:prepilin-type N-terminal cleavage/methylation domain-containing protein [Planctomycetota bacterium]
MPCARPRPRAFTLMELLVVIGIIAVLVALVVVVGSAVTSNARSSLTRDGLRVLDSTLASYIADNGDIPIAYVPDPRVTQNPGQYRNVLLPVADARNMSDNDTAASPQGNQMINSVGLFMTQVNPAADSQSVVKLRGSVNAQKNLSALPSKLSAVYDADRNPDRQPAISTAIDAWGRPMRYVHPSFDGLMTDDPTNTSPDPAAARDVDLVLGAPRPNTTWAIARIRRNARDTAPTPTQAQQFADSDGGSCVGNRPYFYSAGPDGRVGVQVSAGGEVINDFNADNVYTTLPSFPSKF